ncbi:MAG: hypothetical protein K8R89_02340 [Anaerolineae bacterium]|nr:hypothetical protein [Anaerolineae bacterium]
MNLCGKGVWLSHSYDFRRAVEMATQIEAGHLLIKVGHGPYYFPETARELVKRVYSLGLHPLAWIQITDYVPQESLLAIRRAIELNYEKVVLFLGRALVTGSQLEPLAAALASAPLPLEKILLAAPPLAHLPDAQAVKVLARYCQGGWMPLCFPRQGLSAKQLLDRDVYQSLSELSLWWGATPEIYPVLAPLSGVRTAEPFLPEAVIPWGESVMQHGVDFFSVYHAATTEKALWPILQSVATACQPEAEPRVERLVAGRTVPQPEYVTATANDTVWGLIDHHAMQREWFWMWNGHLWDSRGLPRDPDYLQAGWRVRVK